ncbi:hypothetical protein [Nonomuraea sp. NPDC048916]|uniref:hypothetical protein n=1 Tax=Nonomuraea sp. NPDC048916 TaxID=3154232 RepID=UPI0033FB6D97
MADWELRPALVADVEVVAELRAVVLRPDLERLGRYDEQRVRQWLRDGFTPAHTWMIEVDSALAGCVALPPAKDAYRMERFYLDPDSRRSSGGNQAEWVSQRGPRQPKPRQLVTDVPVACPSVERSTADTGTHGYSADICPGQPFSSSEAMP